MSSVTIKFGPKFKKVHREIEVIRSKINQQQGFFVFKSHTYSVDELLESKHHRKIDSITGQIGSDVMKWCDNGAMSDADKESYQEHIDDVEEELNDINESICNRQPTWWEKCSGALTAFVRLIVSNMPIPGRRLLANLGSKLLGFTKKHVVKMITHART